MDAFPDEELEISEDEEITEFSERYDFVETQEQKLRCFIVETMASADVDSKPLISNMQMVYEWITTGTQHHPRRGNKLSLVGIGSSATTK